MAVPAKRVQGTNSWLCSVCKVTVHYGGLTRRTFEQARRKLRQDCRDKGCECKPVLIDEAYRRWKKEEKEAESRKLIEEYKREHSQLGRFGRTQ